MSYFFVNRPDGGPLQTRERMLLDCLRRRDTDTDAKRQDRDGLGPEGMVAGAACGIAPNSAATTEVKAA